MKKFNNTISPFLMLLVPLFLLIGILAFNLNDGISVSSQSENIKIQVPTLKDLIQTVLK